MILSRFLKPKWQHADPETRKQAVQGLENNDPTLHELAQQDPDLTVRCTALERICDLDFLENLARNDANTDIQTAAAARYRTLLAGQAADSPILAKRLEQLRCGSNPDIVDYLLRHAVEPELRLAALAKIHEESTLTEIAQQDSHSDVRLAALERVCDPQLIDQIARHNRNRDKRLYRRARERLDALTTAQTSAAHREHLCAEMENLQWDGESGANAGRFPKLEQEWRDQEATAPSEWRERFAQARAHFLAARQASVSRRNQRLELAASLDALLERLHQETEPNVEISAAIHYATHEAPAAWVQFGPAQDAEIRRLEERFQQRIQDIQEQERILQRNHARAERLRDLLQQTEILLSQPSEVHDSEIKQLRQRWEALEHPESRLLTHELQSRFDGLLAQLRTRLQRQVQQRDQEWQELQDIVRQLETAAEEGELQCATELQEQARYRFKHNIGLSRAQMASIEERLQACLSRLNELRDWRRWGAYQAREQLCAAAETLIDLQAEPPEIAQRIQQARNAWKDLDRHEGAAPKTLWKRFNHACERAYAPCQAYFEAQNRERRLNLEKKQAICNQLEQFEANTDWQTVDWREADRLRRRAQEHWYKSGPVNRTDRKTLDRRFQHILQRLDHRLDAERDRELQRRQQLIRKVQALVDSSDLRAAIEAAKRAQAEWHPTVQVPPHQEQALWKEFRAACDAVFARRQAEQQAIDAERQSHLHQKRALCAEIESLAALDNIEQFPQARTRLQTAQKEWETIGSVPKTDQQTLDQRFESAVRQFNLQERILRQANARQAFENLHQRARLCAQLEALLATVSAATTTDDVAATLAKAQEIWPTLPALPAAARDPMQQRFETIVQTLTHADTHAIQALQTQLERNLEQKRIGCVCMEIAAGIESPPEWAQLRMEHQVARLSASLTGTHTKANSLDDPRSLRERWCLTGALPAEAETDIDARFLRALYAWWRQEDA